MLRIFFRNKNHLLLFLIFLGLILGGINLVIAWTNPSQNPPGGGGALSVDGGGNLSVANKRITNLGNPAAATDAVSKDYVDKNGAVGGAAAREWGEGRTNVGVLTGSGECTNTVAGKTIIVSRSNRPAHWDAAGAVCPAGWWVCTAAERGTASGCNASGANPAQHWIRCYAGDNLDEFRVSSGDAVANEPTTNQAWVSDARTSAGAAALRGPTVSTSGVSSAEYICSVLPAWCCAYQ